MTGLDGRKVENIVDQHQQSIGRIEDTARVFRLPIVQFAEILATEDLCKADDRVERGA